MNLNNALDSIRTSVTEDLNKGINTVFGGLVTNISVHTVPESLFSSYFLPGFLGQNPNPNWLAQWIGIAGSPTAEVSVISPKGAELFRVPPVLLSKDVLFTRARSNFSSIVQHSHLLQNSAYGKDAFLNSAMADKSQELSSVPSMNLAVTQWAHIFSFYGITVDGGTTPDTPPEDDMFEY